MELSCPVYYEEFSCLAGACPDSCCKEWSVWVDRESADRYRALPGPLGDKLRQALTEEDGVTVLQIENGRCPMWRGDGLCRIQYELGEEALCQTCRDFPRIQHDFGDFGELQLELSCPEAARLILGDRTGDRLIWQVPGEEEPEYDIPQMEEALGRREQVMDILLSPELREKDALLALLDLLEEPGVKEVSFRELVQLYREREVLTELWPQKLEGARLKSLHPLVRPLARYLVERYWLRGELMEERGKLCFILSACLLISSLEGDFRENAQLWSKEIENSDCNADDLMDCAYTDGAMTPQGLRYLLGTVRE